MGCKTVLGSEKQCRDILRLVIFFGRGKHSSSLFNRCERLRTCNVSTLLRFVNKDWKRVLISEIEANIRPHAGEEILESLLEPAGATPKARDDFGGADDGISDTERLRACVQWEQC